MKKTIFAVIAVLSSLVCQARERVCFDSDWRFFLGDSVQMASAEYHDSWWRKLDVPHDWAIEGDFYVSNPSGAGGGALPGGIGWYRKHFDVSHLLKAKGRGDSGNNNRLFKRCVSPVDPQGLAHSRG